jgi:hypothetical protein
MKKTLLTLPLFFLCCWYCGYGQTPDWVWARSASSGVYGKGEGWNIAVDNFDNIFITGYFSDTISFGPYALQANYGSAYLAKYDANGNIKWVTSNTYFNDSSVCFSRSICADKHGNSYLTGYFTDSVVWGAFTLIANGNNDIFITKFDSMGQVQWAKCAGGIYGEEGFGVACDASGNVYITGRFNSSSITFGAYTLINSGSFNVFLVKFDNAGNVLWAKCSNGDDAGGFSATTDASGNVYVTGYFGYSNIISFGSDTLSCAGNDDIFLVKYDSSDNVLWARGGGGTGDGYGYSVTVDSTGNVYLTGYFNSSALSFGSHTINLAGGGDSFLAKYDSSGNALWAKDISGGNADEGYSVAADKNGRIYISGSFVYDTLNFDTISLLNPVISNYGMFIICSDSSGHALWGKALAECGDDNNAVAVGPSGCIYVGGDFSTINPLIIGNDALYLSGYENAFVAKLCYTQIGENTNEISNTKELVLYPNPFNAKLTVATKVDGEFELTLFDVTSRKLLSRSFINTAIINTERLAAGVYIYEIY